MVRAALIIFGILAYLAATQWGYHAAQAGSTGVQKLYTRAPIEAAAISASNR